MTVTLDDINSAAGRLADYVFHTPVLNSPVLDQQLGARVFFKAECQQRTGSFKFRGAFNAVRQIADKGTTDHVVAYSSGNHAQGIAAAAHLCGLSSTIVMPDDAPAIKRRHTEAYGAKIVPYNRLNDDRDALAEDIVHRHAAVLVKPFDDVQVISGQGTVGLEFATEMMRSGVTLDAVLVPCGGGGLTAGVATAFASLSPASEIIPCEPAHFDDYGRSLAAGERVPHHGGTTICDAIMVKEPGVLTFEINRKLVSRGLSSEDFDVRRAVAFSALHLKTVVEPGGAVGLAALLSGSMPAAGKSIGVVLSGGNISAGLLSEILLSEQSDS